MPKNARQRQQLIERLYAALAQSTRWQPAPALLDGMTYRLEDFPVELSATTEIDLLLTVLMHRPEYLTSWHQHTRQPRPDLVIQLLNLEPTLGRNMTGPLLERSLLEPTEHSAAYSRKHRRAKLSPKALLTIAESWQQRDAKPRSVATAVDAFRSRAFQPQRKT